jgi:GTPase SAR1 family protein
METTNGRIIGQDFFDLRSRVGAALNALAKLAPEAGANAEHAAMLENLVTTLKDPFVFVVVGEVNVGKSTFLNALLAAEITQTGVIPTTDKILFFKHGPQLKRFSVSRTLDEVHAPVDCLRDFHIVDTPGTNSIANEHQEITERFVPNADLVIFVFSAMNPWGASAWQFLDKVHRHWMRHVIFVLQQCDLRTEEEIAAILDYMRMLCRQRFDREFPIFPVSAKKAYLARSGGLDRDRLMAESGFLPLESHISQAIGSTGQRLGKLTAALHTAGGVLSAAATSTGSRFAAREEKSRVLREIEYELMQAEDRTHSKLAPGIEATELDFERESGVTLARVRGSFTAGAALRSVFREKRTVTGLERSLLEHVRATSIERWSNASKIIEDDITTTAERLADRMTTDLKVQMRDELQPDPEFWQLQKQHFVNRVDEVLQRSVEKLELERSLQPMLSQTRKAAAGMVFVALLSLAGAMVLGLQKHWMYMGLVIGGGLVISGVLWFMCIRALKRTKLATAERLAAAKPELRSHLASQLYDEVRSLYEHFTRILQPTRDKLTEQETRHAALQSQLRAVEQTFHGLDRELSAIVTVTPR